MAQIAQAGSGKGPPACWPAEALNPWQQATHLGSPTAAAKLADQQRIFSQFNLTQDDLPSAARRSSPSQAGRAGRYTARVTTSSRHLVRFTLNGTDRELTVPANMRLIDLLRDELGLTGTKEGCSVGVCGACSVLVDDRLSSACLLPAAYVDGAHVTTIEGLAPDDEHLTPVQDAFIRHGGFQCGICTPGQIIAATALLAEKPKPSVDEIKSWMMGNLCRCTGYYKIIESIVAAAESDSTSVPRLPVGVS